MMMRRIDVLALAGFVALCEAVGALGSLVTVPAIPGWYASLRKPTLTPPDWVFGPVWTTLFALIGVAAFVVWRAGWHRSDVRRALGLFGAQLALTSLWSALFFGLRSPGAALVEIGLLWLAIAAMGWRFGRIATPAGILIVPYLAWVSFAVYLNAGIWRLN